MGFQNGRLGHHLAVHCFPQLEGSPLQAHQLFEGRTSLLQLYFLPSVPPFLFCLQGDNLPVGLSGFGLTSPFRSSLGMKYKVIAPNFLKSQFSFLSPSLPLPPPLSLLPSPFPSLPLYLCSPSFSFQCIVT